MIMPLRECITRSSTEKLFTPFEELERVFHLTRKLFKRTSLDYSSSPEFDLFSDLENQSEEEIDEKAHFELKGQFLKELRDNTFSGSDNDDANEHIEKVLEIFDLFHIPNLTQDQIMPRVFPMSLTGDASRWLKNELGLDVPTRKILDSKGPIPSMKAADAKKAIQDMANHSQICHNGMSTRTRSTDTSDGLDAIQA
ncbi:hypothetical protein Tco_0594860 [Tanacetum coccineum]